MKYVNIVAILSLLIFVSCGAMEDRIKDEKNTKDTETTSFNEKNNEKSVYVNNEKDTNKDTIALVDITEKKDTVKTTDNDNKIEVQNNTNSAKKFHIIVGSFKKEANAKSLNSKLSKKGNKSEVLCPIKEFHRVVYKSFEKEADARKALKQLRTEKKDETIWLYKNI